jgi:DNA (cytosine-5)-methyltransferase 1
MITHASVFSGIGGFDLAAEWMGWQNVFQCETDPFCRQVLTYRFPQCDLFSDIKTSNFSKYHGTIDVITGGFPCQPFSVAGKRKGTNDDRYLWPEMLRVLHEVRPQWFVGENVCGLLTLQSGVVFERVCADLEDARYAVQSFVIPACAVGAPHRRDRIWIVAYADGIYAARQGYEQKGCENGAHQSQRIVSDNGATVHFGDKRASAHADNERAGRLPNKSQTQGTPCSDELPGKQHSIPNWDIFPTQPPVCNRNDGLPGKLADISFSKWRNESIKALGNAIVPQVAFQIFKAIESVTN